MGRPWCSEVTARRWPISLVPDGLAWYIPGMSDDRNISHLPHWIAAMLIGLPVLYVASVGPACWLVDREMLPMETAVIYEPVLQNVPPCLWWYLTIGGTKSADETAFFMCWYRHFESQLKSTK